MGSGRLELKEDDVEDRHRVNGRDEDVVECSVLACCNVYLLKCSIYVSLLFRVVGCD